MRTRGASTMLGCMSQPAVVLRLELDEDGDAIRGRVSSGQRGWTMEFVGWAGLAAAIEQASAHCLTQHGE